MKNNEQKPTTPQQPNCNQIPLFEPLNLEQQDSVVGGFLSLSIFNVFPGVFIPGRAEAVEIALLAIQSAQQATAQAAAQGFSIDFNFNFLID